jgi:hypothetical protein
MQRRGKTRQDNETTRRDDAMQHNVAWRHDGTTQRDNTNDETQHDNATTNQTGGHGKRQRRDDKRRRRWDERGAEAAETFFLDSHRFQGEAVVELLST